jgi:DNA-binding transcriptional LysR family regulator
MDKLTAMQIFVRVAELASFTRAADSLGLPKASVSTAVQHLETLLGSRLLHRTTRKVQMTQDGQTFYERCKDVLSDIDELESLFQQTPLTLQGRLRVDMPTSVAKDLVIPHLPAFLARYPGIDIELSSTDRRVDVVREGFDCVLRVGTLNDSGLIARPLGELRLVNCVSPGYIAEHGEPRHKDDLANHLLIRYVSLLGSKAAGFEYRDRDSDRYVTATMKSVITVNNAESYTDACIAGLGVIQAPLAGMRPHLASGALIEILSDLQAEPMPVSLLYPNRRHLSKRVQVFMDWLTNLMTTYTNTR